MFDVGVTKEQREYAWNLVQHHNFGRRGNFDGDKERQYTGILGQTIMADGLELPRPSGIEGFDNGVDFTILGQNVDLKTIGRTTKPKWNPRWVNNLVASQLRYETDFYIFSSIHKIDRIFTVVGMLPKAAVLRMAPLPVGAERKRHDGTTFLLGTETYEIPNTELTPLRFWGEIVWVIGATVKSYPLAQGLVRK